MAPGTDKRKEVTHRRRARGSAAPPSTLAPSLARLAIARPRATLAGWIAIVAALALLGTGVEGRLTQSIFVLPDTETERAVELASSQFGDGVFVPVLLEGPPSRVDRQGPALVRAIASRPDARVLSPWDRGVRVATLRPRPRAAMVLAAINRPQEELFDETADEIRGLVDSHVRRPVEASITGMPVIGSAIKDETYDSAAEAERVAIPVLVVVLLLVFRAPIAAAIPAVVGLTTVLAAEGAIWLAAGSVSIDPISITLATMMGLALGVDYTLLIVTRFREEIAGGVAPNEAALAAMGTAGRTVAFAGGALAAAMLVAMAVAPGKLLVSAAIGVLASTVISVASALLAIPAALSLLGPTIDRWRVGRVRPAGARPRWVALVLAALRRPGAVALAIALPLLLLTTPALGLDTGPPDVAQLPGDNRERRDFERVSEVMGPGWAAPFEVLMVSDKGAITEPRRLRTLQRWQRGLARSDQVASVVGPGALAGESERARHTARTADRSVQRVPPGIGRLAAAVREAERGASELSRAQVDAAAAIAELARGGEDAASGAALLATELRAATGGVGLIAAALDRLGAGGERLLDALRRARSGTARLGPRLSLARDLARFQAASGARLLEQSLRFHANRLDALLPPARSAQAELATALDELEAMGIGRTDPRYRAVVDAVTRAYAEVSGREPGGGAPGPGYAGLETELERARDGILRGAADAAELREGLLELGRAIDRVRRGVGELRRGLGTLRAESGELAGAVETIRGAVAGLGGGIAALGGSAAELSRGLGGLAAGTESLSARALDGGTQVRTLVLGLDRTATGARRLKRRTASGLDAGIDPGLFDSGYFVLAGIDSASRTEQRQARVAVNVDSGGEAGRVIVVPSSGPNDEATRGLRGALSDEASVLGERLGADAAVGGQAAALADYDEVTSHRLVWLILALAAVSYVLLVPIFRSLWLPAIAVALNLLSVGATFGAMALLFQGADPPLGGPGYIDAVSINAIYAVIFGLSLDYQVFLVSRMREGWSREQNTERAIAYGLRHTAAVVTGAAAIMIAVFVAFASTDVAGTRQFGVGLTIAVALDATVVRLLLLPAAMRLAGDRCWTLPPSLDRLLPRLAAD